MNRLRDQIETFRLAEDVLIFMAIVLATSFIAYNVGLMNGRLGF